MKILGFELDRRTLVFVILFSAIGLVLQQVNFSQIVGVIGLKEQPYFTFFQFVGPMAGGILGAAGGALSVLLVSIANFVFTGQAIGVPVVVSLFTMSAAAIYFGAKGRASALIGPLAMLLFWMHPAGFEAWYYAAAFWWIPVAAVFFKDSIIARSLGSTFTAHAIGSVAYLYAFNMPAAAFAPLIPIVVMERLVFAAGICVSYYFMNTWLDVLSSKVDLSFLNIEKKHALLRA